MGSPRGETTKSIPHVLTVDDSLVDRTLIEKLLHKFSCRVTTTDSATKALDILGVGDYGRSCPANKVHMIITDYCMPGMTGYDLLKKIKGSFLKDVPVVVMSSDVVPARVNRCMEEGAHMFLKKPLTPSDLKKLIRLIMDAHN